MKHLFSDQEIRAVVIFLPLAAAVILGIALLRPRTDATAARQMEARMERRADTASLRPFDPNRADYDELRSLGLTKFEAVSLLRYRASGRVFRIPEDVALCYAIDDSLYRRLAPYIRIGRRYAYAPRGYRTERVVLEPQPPAPFRIDTVGAAYLRAIGALSKRQAEAFVRWRDMSGIYDMEELRACYVVSDSVAAALEPYIIFPDRAADKPRGPLELNTADSAELVAVAGIGPKTAERIIAYRARLGGFVRMEQLAEIPGVTERNFERFSKQICCDSLRIRKIDINFASPNELARHPYIDAQSLRRLLKQRQLKGGWSHTGELIEANIFTEEEAARIAPYLCFDTPEMRNPDPDPATPQADAAAQQPAPPRRVPKE